MGAIAVGVTVLSRKFAFPFSCGRVRMGTVSVVVTVGAGL